MKKKSYIACLCTLALGLSVTSCDDHADDARFRSYSPLFSDVEFKMLENQQAPLTANEKMVITGVQKKFGKLLNLTKYEWSVDTVPGNTVVGATHFYKKEVVYDKDRSNPTDTVIMKYPGSYQITFRGSYSTSGMGERMNNTEKIDKGSINYEGAPHLYKVTIRKRFTVNK